MDYRVVAWQFPQLPIIVTVNGSEDLDYTLGDVPIEQMIRQEYSPEEACDVAATVSVRE